MHPKSLVRLDTDRGRFEGDDEFEQIYQRARTALNNALAAFDYQGRPEAVEALRSADWTAHMVADGMQVTHRLQRRGYVDAGAATVDGALPTFTAQQPIVRIDYIWASTPLAPAVKWCRRWQTDETPVASDHLPVLAEIDL